MIFDEPADHLDEATATLPMEDLMAETSGRTRIVITHRPVPAEEGVQVMRLAG